MTKTRVVVIGALAAAGLVAGLLVVFLGGKSNPPVAHVGDQAITRDQLESAVDHFRREAKTEGTPFPDESSARFRVVRNRLLGVLVYRAELAQAAQQLGIRVTNIQVLRRMNGSTEERSTDEFEYDTVKAQLMYERIYAKVTRGVTGATIPERVARKNAAMKRHIDRLERDTEVPEGVANRTFLIDGSVSHALRVLSPVVAREGPKRNSLDSMPRQSTLAHGRDVRPRWTGARISA